MDTRSALIETAVRLFADRGYDAVGVQELVTTVGVTKPTLYHHFGSKNGLLLAILDEYHQPLLASLEEAARYRHDLGANLYDILVLNLKLAAEQAPFFRLLLTLWVAPPGHETFEPAIRLRRQQLDVLERLFIEAAQDHGNMRGRHRRYAKTYLSLLDSVVSWQLAGDPPLSEPERRDIVHQFSHGLYS